MERPAQGSGRPAAWEPPGEFDEYRLIRLLGRGATGQVFLAHDTVLERPVAVKFLPALGATALARFLNEARAAARVQHPNVVTLYRVGQIGERAYLASEYTRGVGLDRLAKPVPWREALELARDLARGLAAAHRRGVLHRDVKPANAMLTETGQVKLLDFGLAKVVDPGDAPGGAGRPSPGPETPPEEEGALVGSPSYLPPEIWAGEEHTPRSDLYSLGVVLYELCSGRSPFRGIPLAELPQAVTGLKAPPLAEAAPSVEPTFAAIVDRCLERDPLRRFPSADALLDALEAVGAADAGVRIPEGNPYRGLRPFEAEHRALFFGRQREVRGALERLRAEPFLLLAGDSGVGKSSLCAAGLLPGVQEGALGGGRAWSFLRLLPGHRPLAALAGAVAPLLGIGERQFASGLREDPEALARGLKLRLGVRAGLLLYVDQLEELITLAPPEEARTFAELLAPIAQGLPGVRLLATARSDFLTRLSALPCLGETLSRAIHLVGPLGEEEMREAVVGPARVKGVTFESEALVKTLVDSTVTAGGGLPLLQFALALLWEARDSARSIIPAASLTALGGVTGALARYADGVVEALPVEQRSAARSLLLRLVTDDGTRARRTEDELTGGDARYRAALEALVRGRLLVAREGGDGSTYEVAHEALLDGWATLARWLAEEAETRELRRRLEAAAREWERLGHARDALWGARQLAEAAALEQSSLPSRERRFLVTSRLALRRARRRRRAVALGFALALAATAGAARLKLALDRGQAADRELAGARRLLEEARAHAGREEAARRAAFRAFDTGDAKGGERAWSRALEEAPAAERGYAEAEERLEGTLVLDPERRRTRDALVDVLLERATRAERSGRLELRDLLASRLRLLEGAGERWRRWTAPAALEISAPAETRLSVARYAGSAGGPLTLEPVTSAGAAAPGRLELPAGSYLLTLAAPGSEVVRLPLLLGRGEERRVAPRLPARGEVPPGFAYVPEGRFRFGSASEESVRQFFNAVPIHDVETGAFLIARTETTWADWLAYLDALPEGERARRTPRVGSTGMHGELRLSRAADGRWELGLQPADRLLRARAGEPLRYPGRKVRAEVDWLKLPVVGISYDDAQAYAAWLDGSGRVRGARLCTEVEWERAARGADGREYPHGDRLAPDDANFDLTYGKEPLGFGPDEVGSHPASVSPFGVLDLAGNVWEWTRSSLAPDQPVARGGSYSFAAGTCRATNRETPERSYRDLNVGLRICATAR